METEVGRVAGLLRCPGRASFLREMLVVWIVAKPQVNVSLPLDRCQPYYDIGPHPMSALLDDNLCRPRRAGETPSLFCFLRHKQASSMDGCSRSPLSLGAGTRPGLRGGYISSMAPTRPFSLLDLSIVRTLTTMATRHVTSRSVGVAGSATLRRMTHSKLIPIRAQRGNNRFKRRV